MYGTVRATGTGKVRSQEVTRKRLLRGAWKTPAEEPSGSPRRPSLVRDQEDFQGGLHESAAAW